MKFFVCLGVFFGVGSGGGRVGESGWWVRVDVKEDLMIFVKIQKKKNRGGGGVGSGGGVRVDVNDEVKFL